MVENGIKPVYVFDGKPPSLKSGVVSRLPPSEVYLGTDPLNTAFT